MLWQSVGESSENRRVQSMRHQASRGHRAEAVEPWSCRAVIFIGKMRRIMNGRINNTGKIIKRE